MPRLLLTLTLLALTANAAHALGFDLPRLFFPSQGEQVTQPPAPGK